MSNSGDCYLTPQARAFSSILSALIGSVVNGLTSGWLIAFITGWIAWFAFFRVVINGSYMFYRSITGTWSVEHMDEIDEHEMLNKRVSPDPDPESDAQTLLINQGSNPRGREASPAHIPILSDLAHDSLAAETYHRQVYASVFGQDNSFHQLPKPTFRSIFWPSRSDLALRQQRVRLAQQKHFELRRHYASDRDVGQAVRAYPIMYKQGKLPGPPPTNLAYLAYWQPLNREITILGWFGWVYSALYSPISQIIWISAAASASNSSGFGKIVKGLSIAVTALPLCLDSRVRFAESLQKKLFGGTWAYYAFNLTNSISCTLQGMFCGVLLVWGVVQLRSQIDPFFAATFPWLIIALYPVISLIWAFGSYALAPMLDGGRKRAAQSHWAGYFLDVGIGAFAGLVLAAPAFALYMSSVSTDQNNTGAQDLGEFLSCEGAPTWQKFSAIFP